MAARPTSRPAHTHRHAHRPMSSKRRPNVAPKRALDGRSMGDNCTQPAGGAARDSPLPNWPLGKAPPKAEWPRKANAMLASLPRGLGKLGALGRRIIDRSLAATFYSKSLSGNWTSSIWPLGVSIWPGDWGAGKVFRPAAEGWPEGALWLALSSGDLRLKVGPKFQYSKLQTTKLEIPR